MKKVLIVIISSLAFTSLANIANAGGLPDLPPSAPNPVSNSDAGFYLGVEGGYGNTNWKNYDMANLAGVSTKDDNGAVGRAFLGFDINKYFAIEGGYTYFFNRPKFTLGTLENKVKKTQSYDCMIKGKIPVSQDFDFFGKIGVNYLVSTFDTDTYVSATPNQKLIVKRSSYNVGFGAGLDYSITPNLILDFEWLRFNGDAKCSYPSSDSNFQPHTDMFMIGLRYKIDL
jgi:opacity protein-like surface antigen